MAEEPQIPIKTLDQRLCPACGARVAAKATTCLMCGTALEEESEVAPAVEPEAVPATAPRRFSWLTLAVAAVTATLVFSTALMIVRAYVPPGTVAPLPTMVTTVTETLPPSPTSTSTPVPTPTPTPTPVPPLAHQIQTGETLSGIADTYGLTVDEIMALNPDLDPDYLVPGEAIMIPAATPTPGPAPTLDPSQPTPTQAAFHTHVVQSGETLLSIAGEYGVAPQLLQAVNQIQNPDELPEGQVLVIPLGTPRPTPSPTVNPNATPTPLPPYPRPVLLSPVDGAVFVADAQPVTLQWTSVAWLGGEEWYRVRLFQDRGGREDVFYYTRTSSWRLTPELMPAWDETMDTYHWEVQIVRRTGTDDSGEARYEVVGLRSRTRTFTWTAPTPTPGPTPLP